jgi:hypothetical protein
VRCLSQQLSYGVIVLLCLAVGSVVKAAPAALDRYAGSFSASGTVLEGPNADSHQVRCRFNSVPQGTTGLSLQGTC